MKLLRQWINWLLFKIRESRRRREQRRSQVQSHRKTMRRDFFRYLRERE